jgi:tRNA(Ile)-lysidine synthase
MSTAFEQALSAFAPQLPLVVAYSGGADSTALLLACARKWPGQVRAAHVHHGMQAVADEFAAHCQRVCASLDIPLALRRVDARPAPGDSPEDRARRLRYDALTAMAVEDFGTAARAQAGASVAIAQHADDQAETVLLALTRGAGLAGLSAMPALWQRTHGKALVTLHRPLLRVPASDIRAWLATRSASFIEDPSNRNQALTRNRIRARLLPALDASFPAFRETFARTAAHAAQAQALLLEIAVEDLARVGQPPAIDALRALSRARLANLLRHWLMSAHGQSASAAQLGELLDQLAACSTRGHDIAIKVGAGHVRRDGARLDWLPTPR